MFGLSAYIDGIGIRFYQRETTFRLSNIPNNLSHYGHWFMGLCATIGMPAVNSVAFCNKKEEYAEYYFQGVDGAHYRLDINNYQEKARPIIAQALREKVGRRLKKGEICNSVIAEFMSGEFTKLFTYNPDEKYEPSCGDAANLYFDPTYSSQNGTVVLDESMIDCVKDIVSSVTNDIIHEMNEQQEKFTIIFWSIIGFGSLVAAAVTIAEHRNTFKSSKPNHNTNMDIEKTSIELDDHEMSVELNISDIEGDQYGYKP